MEPELIADYRNEIGEGPTWNSLDGRLYWVDILNGRIFWFDPVTGRHELFFEGDVIGGFTIQADGSFVLFMARGAVRLLRNGKLSTIVDEIHGEHENRFNDVIADPEGRVFCGTMPMDEKHALSGERLGCLYRLDPDGSIRSVVESVTISNGLGFTPDRSGMYFTDTLDRTISLFDYDVQTGSISNRRTFVETPEGSGMPDGMTVDEEGYVWSARVGDSAVVRYSPEGVVDREIRFPAKLVSSAAFGGGSLTELYVTTIGGNKRPEAGPGAGALFRVNAGVRGVPEFFSRIGL